MKVLAAGLALWAILTGGGGLSASSDAPLSNPQNHPSQGHPAGAKLPGGDPSPAPESGRVSRKITLLYFWATWCGPCRQEIATLARAVRQHSTRGLRIVGVNVDRGPRREVERYLRRHRIEWPQIQLQRGLDSELAVSFDITSVPSIVLLDQEAQVIAEGLRGDQLLFALDRLLSPNAP